MANRVCFGNRGSEIGLYVSKPGFNVLTAADADLLFKSVNRSFQVIQRGSISLPAGTTGVTISHPNVGYNPLVLMSPLGSISVGSTWEIGHTFEYLSLTSIRLRVGFVGTSGYTGTTAYLIINKPVTN